MKVSDINITMNLSLYELELINKGCEMLKQKYEWYAKIEVTASTFIHYAIELALKDLDEKPTFEEN